MTLSNYFGSMSTLINCKDLPEIAKGACYYSNGLTICIYMGLVGLVSIILFAIYMHRRSQR